MKHTYAAQMPSRGSLRYLLSVLLPCLCLWACSQPRAVLAPVAATEPAVLTMMPTGENAADLSFLAGELHQYRGRTGVQINPLPSYDSFDTRLRLFQNILAKKSAEPDILEIDNIWPELLADDLIDLKPYLGDEITAIDKSLLEAFTVDGRLVALPLSAETPALYYRTDLLKKYGYQAPPQTWDELERMAKVIQDGERKAGAADFWGYIWQGVEGEPLTCNAMEWQRAEGANLIDNSGAIRALNPAAESALRRARSWVGTISPPSVLEYDEEDASNAWLTGRVAFARGWQSLYGLSKASPLLAKRFSATHLPAGTKGYAWVFGGNGLAVSRYSVNPKAAAEVVRYLISSEVQRRRLTAISSVPSRTTLLSNASLLSDTAFNGWLSEHWREGIFARPSERAGKRYNLISRAYSKTVHDVISGKRDAHQALSQLQAELTSIMRPSNVPNTR